MADLAYSFMQYLHQPLDGDMAWNIVPSADVAPILVDPLGIGAIAEGRTYANPNRFFCHWIFRAYLGEVPLQLQAFTTPIDSVYLACALAKIVVQAVLIFLLAAYATRSINVLRLDFVAAAVLIAPLFQANGYRSYMGVIDPSTTYTFFYALPCAFLLAYFLPLFLRREQSTASPHRYWWWTVPASFLVCLSGPLNPGAVLVAAMLLVGGSMLRAVREGRRGMGALLRSVPAAYIPFLLPAGILSVYSLFLGQYNSITIGTRIPLADMYAQLPMGVYHQFTQKLGFPVLFAVIALHLVLIARRCATKEGRGLLRMARWVGAFALLYILLLPLGGYRDYRPLILRYDTIMPITLALMVVAVASALYILKEAPARWRGLHVLVLAGFAAIFTVADEPGFDKDHCEREALEVIAASPEAVVPLAQACSVLDWRPIASPEDSELNAELLLHWRITDRKKLYYNQ
ncbi:MAG: hypothetical protein KF797_15055 [Flavobacteriales bacterium]|nr:hypothetical protein [Flavobacteriales bacterium]